VTSVGESAVALDGQARPVRPAIAWFDSRGEPQAAWWSREVGPARVAQISGQVLDAHYSVNRLMWLREQEPDSYARVRHWLSLGDLAILRLCGELATDFSLASRTMVFDQRRLDWSDQLLDAAGLQRSLFPPAAVGGTRVGSVTAEASAATGLPVGTPVVLGGHDRLCAAFASRGRELLPVDSTGSAEALVMPVAGYIERDPATAGFAACYADVVPGQFVVSARVGYAGALLDWYRREIESAPPDIGPLDVDQIVGWPLAFSGLVCYPSFGRALGPEWDASVSGGALIGLTIGLRRAQLIQSIIEGVGYALRANLDWLERYTGRAIPALRVEGPMTASRVWMQLKADVSGRRVRGVRLDEATALGAALLAGVGAGLYADHGAAAVVVEHRLEDWSPTQPLAQTYTDVFEHGFRPLPDAIRDLVAVLDRAGAD